MLYFIPAWYLNSEWKENEQLWHIRRMQSEVDDTVKQIQLFQRNDVCEYKILMLSHTPNLRHFLHRQGVFRAPYLSVFDAIQEVRRSSQTLLSFHNLNWPKEIEFIYSPFAVVAMLHGEKYAQIEFGEYGNLIQVDLYSGGQIRRKNIYDDRGFLSCTVVYTNGKKAYEQYLSEEGVWKLCLFADGHVTVNPQSAAYLIPVVGQAEESVQDGTGKVPQEAFREIPFRRNAYASMEEVIEEVFSSYLEAADPQDVFCAALHRQHAGLLVRLLSDRRKLISVFGDRVSLLEDVDSRDLLMHADYIVTDSEDNLHIVQGEPALKGRRMASIPPYDTRIDSGISLQLHVQKILVPVDHLTALELENVVTALAEYLKQNEEARIHLFTRNAAYNREDILLEQISRILEKHGFPPVWARKERGDRFENLLEEEERLPILFVVEQCLNELAVNKCVREQRILVDLADAPDLFLQILCVSIGVPQLLRASNRYMIPGKNGSVIRDLRELGGKLTYYLANLTHWNQAMIHSYELSRRHTADSLIRRWKEVIEKVERDKDIAVGSH